MLPVLSFLFPFKVRPLVFQSLISVYHVFAVICLKSRAFVVTSQNRTQWCFWLCVHYHIIIQLLSQLTYDTVISFCCSERAVVFSVSLFNRSCSVNHLQGKTSLNKDVACVSSDKTEVIRENLRRNLWHQLKSWGWYVRNDNEKIKKPTLSFPEIKLAQNFLSDVVMFLFLFWLFYIYQAASWTLQEFNRNIGYEEAAPQWCYRTTFSLWVSRADAVLSRLWRAPVLLFLVRIDKGNEKREWEPKMQMVNAPKQLC